MVNNLRKILVLNFILALSGCQTPAEKELLVQDLDGIHDAAPNAVWLSHEHILVDFIGADSIQPSSWNHDVVLQEMKPYLDSLKAFNVHYFVDATPNYLGRDVLLLEKIAKTSGMKILTNTGLYGAQRNKFIPKYAYQKSAEGLAEDWIEEFNNGIDGTSVKPGFIKISVDNSDPLDAMHQKLVKAAAFTHLETGLTIASHTGSSKALWPQLEILKETGVAAEAFIWVHAQAEEDNKNYLKAAKTGCWISLDGLGWEFEKHLEAILFAKMNGFLDQILISHDSGWYDPQKETQEIQPYTAIFRKLVPALESKGFTDEELNLLLSVNPSKAFSIGIKTASANKN